MNENSSPNSLFPAFRALLLGLCLLPGLTLAAVVAVTTSSTSSTTTTTNTNTTNTLASPYLPLKAGVGWNLLGNALSTSIGVASAFGDVNTVVTVWKWNAAQSRWQFYTPTMDASTLQSYAAGKGYDVLSTIAPGEGYWLNTKLAMDSGISGPLNSGYYQPTASALNPGWNLAAATGNQVPPAGFISSRGISPTTLWAWDNATSKWYFYAPSMAAQGGSVLADYATGKGYLDFAQSGKTVGLGMGLWINMP